MPEEMYGSAAAADQHSVINKDRDQENAVNYRRTTHPEAQWFPDAGLGMFVHWGIASVRNLDIGWSMMANKGWGWEVVTPDEYFSFADTFDPQNYNPDRFIRAAAEAGFRYAVFTTKHHSGYTMWPSDYGEFGVKKYLPGKDFVRPFVEACWKYGLKTGLYYSPPDWYFNREYMSFNFMSGTEEFPDKPHMNTRHEIIDSLPEMPVDHEKAYHELIRGHVKELLTNYGRIDMLWFDGGPACMTINEIREMQPHIIVNPRMHGYGDTDTPEIGHPDRKPVGWWELATIWNEWGWGYGGEGYRTTGWFLNELATVRSWGGNLLANAAPDRTGDMSPVFYERIEEIKSWMEHSSESMFGVDVGPWPEKCSVPVTVKDNVWYVHFKEDTQEAMLTGTDAPVSVTLLRTGEALEYDTADGKTILSIPVNMRAGIDDVVKVNW